MGFGFHELIAHAAYSRNLSAGTIIGSGTVSNADYRAVGSACIAERRAIEIADQGKPVTDYMRFGDRIRIEMLDADGQSVFGAIDQRVVPARRGRAALKRWLRYGAASASWSSRASASRAPAGSRRAARFRRGAPSSRPRCDTARTAVR